MRDRGLRRHGDILAKLNRGILPVAAALFLNRGQFAPAAAQPATWEGTTTGGDGVSWNSADNWTTNGVADVLPPNTSPGDDLTFGNGTPGTISLNGNEIADSLIFTASGFVFDALPSTDTLTNTTGTINVGSTDTATINAILGGSSGLRMFGTGTLILDNADTYTSATTVNAGTLEIGAVGAINPAGVLTVSSGASLLVDISGTATETFNTSVSNSGNLTISSGDTFASTTSGSVFTQSAGTLTVNGSLSTGGNGFNYSGGSVVGTVQIGSNTSVPTFSLAAGAGNSGAFIIGGEGATFSGGVPRDIQSNQSVILAPTASSGTLTSSANITNAGSLTLSGTSTSTATLTLGTSNTLTNTGTLTTTANATPSTVTDVIVGGFNNSTGTVTINASTSMAGFSITNSSAFTIASGVTLQVPGEITATSAFTQSAGTLTISGSLVDSLANFNDNGGTITGTVTIGNALTVGPTLSFGAGAGHSGTFVFVGMGGSDAGNVPSGVTVTLQPTATTGNLSLPSGFVNNGTMNLIGSTTSTATFTGNSTLTNSGNLTISNTGSPSTVNQLIAGNLTNTSTGTVNVNASLTVNGTMANTGTVNVGVGAVLNLTADPLILNGGTIILTSGTPTQGVLELGGMQFTGSNTTGTIASGTVGAGQSPGYVDLAGATQTMNIGSGSQAAQVVISAPITDGGLVKAGAGTLEVSGANTYTLGTTVNAGTLVIGAANSIPATGGVTIQTGGLMQLATGIGTAATTSLSIDSTSDLDIENNALLINYGSGPDPISSIFHYIETGYSGGAWNGTGGIISSFAAANSGSYGLGYADSADTGNPANLASGQIEIMYTLLGDANLDGKVNGADFTTMAANFNKTVTNGWDEGDFNYDGSVNGADFTLLASNFNQSASQSAVGAADLAALDDFAAANGISLASVPEPVSGAIVMMAVAGAVARRRRSF